MMDALHQLEILWILIIQNIGTWVAPAMRLISMLGHEDFYILVMPMLYWCLDTTLGFRLAVMLLVGNTINSALKLTLYTPRPYWFDTRIKAFTGESSFGMPSGHAQNAAGLWGLMAYSTRQAWLRALLILVIFLIGFSRVFLGVHFISDVLLGWLIGGIMLWLFLKLERPVWAWLRVRTLVQMLAISLATSVLLGSAVLLSAVSIEGWQLPAAWAQTIQITLPGSTVDPLNIEGAFTIAGTWLGLMSGAAWLYRRQGSLDSSGTARQKTWRYAVGVLGILVLWLGLSLLFQKITPPNATAVGYALRYFRYALVGLWISAGAPVLFARLGLSSARTG